MERGRAVVEGVSFEADKWKASRGRVRVSYKKVRWSWRGFDFSDAR